MIYINCTQQNLCCNISDSTVIRLKRQRFISGICKDKTYSIA